MTRFCALMLLLAASFTIAFGDLLSNGDFESPPNPSKLSGTRVDGTNSIPNWQAKGFVEYIKSGYKQGDMVLVVPQGDHAVRLGNDASITQRVKMNKGQFYALTFSFARTCAQDEKLNVSVSPNKEAYDWGILPLQTMYSSVGYDCYAWGFEAEDEEVEITIHNPGNDDDPACGPLIDNVAINILHPPRLTKSSFVKNGNFEEGPYVFHNTSSGILIPPNVEDDHSPLPAWMIDSLKAVKYISSPKFYIPEGKRAIELVAGKESILSQTIRTIPGKTYLMTFDVGDANNGCVGQMEVEAFAGSERIRVTYESKGKGGFVRGKLQFKPSKERSRIGFLSSFYTMTIDGSLCGPVVDDVKVFTIRLPRPLV